ncbi:hypothetical protein ORI20_18685 [Mycobacterium sp. CVI_P3]|uniref:Transposase n=1 Tax=Mycobacterium pinniadriaticum TaxID=2994102 RepID=A0ABT3SH48_9MYCO|nr:hypothetical protein [Mycobacterium pinniadriaticum]MCX2932303.1 hypothetical protein [Mycobacterium pinniadriaticum]MCX2938840.1 hypothetical protein [Mycobacterium pinniadriaticum]
MDLVAVFDRGFTKFREQRRRLVTGNDHFVEVEAFKECLVQMPPHFVLNPLVERLGVFDKMEGVTQHRCTDRQLLVGVCQPGLNASAVSLDLV